MAKNIETTDPFHEEEHEEITRLYEKDKKHTFVPIDQVPDEGVDFTENFDEKKSPQPDGDLNYEERTIAEDKQKELLKKEINIMIGNGVTSVGPDVPMNVDVEVEPEIQEEIEREPAIIPRRKTKEGISSMSSQKVTSRDKSYLAERKDRRPNSGEVKDNLKTMPEHKRRKSIREIWRGWIGK